MPFKNEIISYLDDMESLVVEYDSCNTVLIVDNKLHGFNTDYYGARVVIDRIPYAQKVLILGDGVMGKMILSMIPYAGVCSRNRGNWNKRHALVDTIINCTACGTMSDESPLEHIPATTSLVIDLAAKPNKLQEQCKEAKVGYIPGIEFYKHQFIRQFEIYTGITITKGIFESV
jgi:shikimate dehydrogenase